MPEPTSGPPLDGDLYTVSLPNANFAIIVNKVGRVVWSAPYGRGWVVGRGFDEVRREVERQGGRVMRRDDADAHPIM